MTSPQTQIYEAALTWLGKLVHLGRRWLLGEAAEPVWASGHSVGLGTGTPRFKSPRGRDIH